MSPAERGGIVIGWLTKVVLMLALFGLILFEAGAVVVARVGVDGTTETAAREAAGVLGTTRSFEQACGEAELKAVQGGAAVIDCTPAPDGSSVSVTLERVASTLLIHRIGPLKKFRKARATYVAKTS